MKKILSLSRALALLLLGFGVLCSESAYAQNKVSGVVSDQNGPLPGVTVLQAGTTNGTSTDSDGKFAINVPEGAKLLISFIGYRTEEVVVGRQSNLIIVLKDDTNLLDEVVVTGYGGTQRRAKVTNSIAKVDEKALQVGSFTNPAEALAGAVSGLRVVQSSGNPNAMPSITLRGGTNFDGTSNEPLVVVDGQLRDSMSDINPEDIQSIDILKDAGATAIYGARASNGVILITTRTGREGRREIKFKAKVGMNYFYLPWKFCDAADYIYWMRRAYNDTPWADHSLLNQYNAFGIGGTELTPTSSWNILLKTPENSYLLDKGWQQMADPLDASKTIIYKNTRAADYNINSPSISQDYNMNMSGGNDKGSYYAGIGYNSSDGLARTTYYNRLSFLFNGSYRITDWLTSKSGVNFSRTKYRSLTATQGSDAGYFGRALSVPPTIRFEDEDGNQLIGSNSGDGNQNYQNDKFFRDNENIKATLNQTFTAKLLDCLTLNVNANWYFNQDYNESFNKDYQTNANYSMDRTRTSSGLFRRYFTQTYNATLNFNKEVATNHNLDAMVGFEWYDRQYRYLYAQGKGAPTDDFRDLGLTSQGEGDRVIDSEHNQYRIASFFGRINYDYAGKYLLSATFREDGYSALLNNRWGFFPGISAGWVFSNEDFVKENAPVLSFGKIRASYGVNGNASGIGPYSLQGAYSSLTYDGNIGYYLSTLPNRDLRWERTNTFEFGADVSFFENRLNANITYYNRLTSDKYANLSLPSTTGYSSIKTNNGKFRNQGVEIELSGKIIRSGDFQWDIAANITYNRNRIVSLPDNGLPNNRQGGTEVYTGRNLTETTWVGGYQEGQEPGVIVGYIAEGLFRSESDFPEGYMVKSGHYSGKYQYSPAEYAKLSAGDKANAIQLGCGDVKWKDINGDGIIDAKDQVVLGNTTPHWTGGFNTTFRWKDLSFYASFDYGFGFKTGQNGANDFAWFMGCMQGTFNMPTDVWDTYSADNPNGKYPRYVWADQLGPSNYYRTSSMFVYDGAYLAVRELCLSYSLPKKWMDAIHAQKIELSITGQNLGYITKARVVNPSLGGLIQSTYPVPRTLLFGATLTF